MTYYYPKGWEPHSSHKMGEWENTIVQLASTPRFGSIRRCLNCEAEQAEAVAGRAAHRELTKACPAVPDTPSTNETDTPSTNETL